MKFNVLSRGEPDLGMPREVRRVVKELRTLARPQADELLDVPRVREELRQLIESAGMNRDDEKVAVAIDRYVDACVADFLRAMGEQHSARLSRLEELSARVRPYLERSAALERDLSSQWKDMDAASDNAFQHTIDPEAPIRYRHVPPAGED